MSYSLLPILRDERLPKLFCDMMAFLAGPTARVRRLPRRHQTNSVMRLTGMCAERGVPGRHRDRYEESSSSLGRTIVPLNFLEGRNQVGNEPALVDAGVRPGLQRNRQQYGRIMLAHDHDLGIADRFPQGLRYF